MLTDLPRLNFLDSDSINNIDTTLSIILEYRSYQRDTQVYMIQAIFILSLGLSSLMLIF